MEQRIKRRSILGIAAASVAAVVSGCGETPKYKMDLAVNGPEGYKAHIEISSELFGAQTVRLPWTGTTYTDKNVTLRARLESDGGDRDITCVIIYKDKQKVATGSGEAKVVMEVAE